MSAMGTGTEFVEAEIKRLYPNLPTFRIDRESTPTRKEAQKVIEQYKTAEAAVLIGTEMAMYYLEEADHSIIVAFDTLFNIPSYKSGERILNFYITIRERTKGKILIQTKNADDPILDVIRFGNYASWYKNELSEREEYGYPPYNTIMKISWYGKDEEREAAKAYIGEILENFNPDIFDSTVIRKGKREACTNAIIRPKREDWSLSVLLEGKNFSEVLREKLAKLPEDVIIAINPENLL